MKKILLTTAALAAISTSAYAEMDNQFYLRGDVDAAYFTKFKSQGGTKIKAETVMGIDLGAGYYVMDNVRAELIYTQPFSIKMKGSRATGTAAPAFNAAPAAGTTPNTYTTNVSLKHKPTIRALFARVHGDVIDLGMGKIFLTGGLGWAQVKDSVTATASQTTVTGIAVAGVVPSTSTSVVTTTKAKTKNNIAWTVGAGATFDVAEGVHLDVAYSYRAYGKSKARVNTTNGNTYGGNNFNSHVGSAGIRFDI